jgi:hypothetical protein
MSKIIKHIGSNSGMVFPMTEEWGKGELLINRPEASVMQGE